MPSSKSSLLTVKSLSKENISILFSKALEIKKSVIDSETHSIKTLSDFRKKTAALLFFEPSTRTRFSFEMACARAGIHPVILDGGVGTSLEKGETIEDTILNIQAMQPDLFIIRCNDQTDLAAINSKIKAPIVNAGWGKQGHPTQALLDALTIFDKLKEIENKNILFVGDVKHSRVFASHLELAAILNYNVGVCAPADFVTERKDYRHFENLQEALVWADVVVALRVQKERHDNENIFLLEDYKEKYSFNNKSLLALKKDALIMHPGPINYGVEIESEILSDPRCVILEQVHYGVYLREALVRQVITDGTKGV